MTWLMLIFMVDKFVSFERLTQHSLPGSISPYLAQYRIKQSLKFKPWVCSSVMAISQILQACEYMVDYCNE